MFGYVNIYKDELKVKEYNIFKSYYCGLCKRLGKLFSTSVRMGLSYDFAFLALVLSSVNSEENNINYERCLIHYINKNPVTKNDDMIDYSAYMSIITTYFKLIDDYKDKKALKSMIAILFYRRHLKKAAKKYPEEYAYIKENLDKLNSLEKEKSADIDLVADCFAKILAKLFSPDFLEVSDKTRENLGQFGYYLGRFIYVIDAYNDIYEDVKEKNYNPILLSYPYENQPFDVYKELFKEKMDFSLMLTLSKAAEAFQNIEFKKNRGIVDNIVYLGLRNKKDFVFNTTKKGEK